MTRVVFAGLIAGLLSATLVAQQTEPPGILVSRQLAASEGLKVGSVVRLATDPEGTRVELSCEMEQLYDGSVTYQPREWHDFTAALNLWGPGPTWRA